MIKGKVGCFTFVLIANRYIRWSKKKKRLHICLSTFNLSCYQKTLSHFPLLCQCKHYVGCIDSHWNDLPDCRLGTLTFSQISELNQAMLQLHSHREQYEQGSTGSGAGGRADCPSHEQSLSSAQTDQETLSLGVVIMFQCTLLQVSLLSFSSLRSAFQCYSVTCLPHAILPSSPALLSQTCSPASSYICNS